MIRVYFFLPPPDHSISTDNEVLHTGSGSNLRTGLPLKSGSTLYSFGEPTFPISAIGNGFLGAKLSCGERENLGSVPSEVRSL